MSERLYLCKEEPELYVEMTRPYPQHQLDAVRFLYRLFKLKQPGAIINDPSGYGKRAQVALFIAAIRPLMNSSNKQVLILCDEACLDHWRKQLEECGSCLDEIVTSSSTLFAKKVIFINTHKDGVSFSRKQWELVVIDSQDMTKDLQIVFKAQFKIWITNVDLKQNLSTFTSIYNWLSPNNKFKMEDFEPKDNSLKEVVSKSLLFDAFLEEIVLRRNNLMQRFDVPEKPKPVNIESPKKRSAKNKDPTGTKVKTTKKRKINDESVTNKDNEQNSSDKGTLNHDRASTHGVENNHIDTDSLFNFETGNDVDQMEDKSYDQVDNNRDKNQLKRSKILSEDSQLDFSVAMDDIVANENINLDDSTTERNEIVTLDTPIESEVKNFATSSQKGCQHFNKTNEVKDMICVTKECNEKVSKESLNNKDLTQVQGIENKANTGTNSGHEIGNPKADINETDELKNTTKNDIQTSANEMNLNEKSVQEIDQSKCDKNQTDVNKVVQNNSESSTKANKSVMSCLKEMEQKLLECERKATEKFKGSFLDSLF